MPTPPKLIFQAQFFMIYLVSGLAGGKLRSAVTLLPLGFIDEHDVGSRRRRWVPNVAGAVTGPLQIYNIRNKQIFTHIHSICQVRLSITIMLLAFILNFITKLLNSPLKQLGVCSRGLSY